MRILCLGDVVGSHGCDAVRATLPSFKQQHNINLVIANGENSADGNGILPHSAEHLFTSGVDVITGGNHIYRRREIYRMLDENDCIIRPANFPSLAVGKGICIVDTGRTIVGVINLMGVVYMEPLKSPFEAADEMIEQCKAKGAKIIILDFHAEATAEKRALGYYLDGRISALFGTHTHVQTSDACVLPNGTGYITDVGMCGPKESVLGVKPSIAIAKMTTKMPVRFENADGECIVCGAVFNIDNSSGLAVSSESICIQ